LILGAHQRISHTAPATQRRSPPPPPVGCASAFQLILTVGTLALAAAFIMISLRAMRIGLLTKMMGIVGIIGGVLFLIPLTPLPVIQALWLCSSPRLLMQFAGAPLPEASERSSSLVPGPGQGSSSAAPAPARRMPARGMRRWGCQFSRPGRRPRRRAGPSPSASKKRKRRPLNCGSAAADTPRLSPARRAVRRRRKVFSRAELSELKCRTPQKSPSGAELVVMLPPIAGLLSVLQGSSTCRGWVQTIREGLSYPAVCTHARR